MKRIRHPHVALAAVATLAVLTVACMKWAQTETWYSPAKQPRRGSDSLHQIWEQAQITGKARLPAPTEIFQAAEADFSGDVIYIEREAIVIPRPHGDPIPSGRIDAPPSQRVVLPGDAALNLTGLALMKPGEEKLTWRHPSSLKPLAGISTSPVSLVDLGMEQPVLYLLFEGEAVSRLRAESIQVFDARTQWPIGTATVGPVKELEVEVMVPLTIWNDTPVLVALEVPCGKPLEEVIPPVGSTQVLVDGSVRFQFVTAGAGSLRPVGTHGEVWDVLEGPGGYVIGRISPCEWGRQSSLSWKDTPAGSDSWLGTMPKFQSVVMSRAPVEPTGEPLVFRVYPERQRVWYRLAGLPDMPNGRKQDNLFTARISSAIPEFGDDAPLRAAARAVQLDLSLTRHARTPGLLHDGYLASPAGPVTTPAELVNDWLEAHPGYQVKVDMAHSRLIVAPPPPPWTERVKAWWDAVKPSWK